LSAAGGGSSNPTAARTSDRGYVYPPREDSLLLARAARWGRGRTVLEIGAGAGLAALEAARAGARCVVATDLNPHALRAVRAAARAHGLRVEVVRTDLARGLARFDLVLANPPYLPTRAGERDPERWANLALDGGRDGTRVLGRLLATLPGHLTPGGRACVLVSTVQDPIALARLATRWRAQGGQLRRGETAGLEGERLVLWELQVGRVRRVGRRSARRAPGTRGRRRSPGRTPAASNPGPAPGRTTARGGASTRRRSPPSS